MSDSLRHLDSRGFLSFIEESASTITKAVIHPPGAQIKSDDELEPVDEFTVSMHFDDGCTSVIRQEELELLLNTGILSKCDIKIEFEK